MSMYQLVHGVNPMASLLIGMLGVHSTLREIPRFRDCWWNGEHIVLYTRTGGGNRAFYESAESNREHYPDADYTGPFNTDLRDLPGYDRDEDDSFDSTYALFYFTPQAQFAEAVKGLVAEDATPEQKWKKFLADMDAGVKTPQTERAIKAMEPVFDALKKHLR